MLAYGQGEQGIYFPDITYGFYKTVANAFGLKYQEIPLDNNLQIRVEDYIKTQGMVILANPNAPTGLRISQKEIRRIIEANADRIVVIDEAYVDFGTQTCIPMIHTYNNLIVVHTMSKSRNIAGLHVGYAIGNAELMAELNNLKNCFNPNNINQVTLDAAVAAVEDFSALEMSCLNKIKVRIWFTKQLKKMGYQTLESYGNFVFTRHEGYDAQALVKYLNEQGILVRYYANERISEYIRISVGTAQEMEMVVETLQKYVRENTQEAV